MTDKIQKIRKELERLREQLQDKVETSDFIAGEVFIMNYFLTFIDSLQEEPVSKQKLSNVERIGKDWKKPVSEPNKELEETYLAVFDKKFPILPTLKGKQLADYKNFLNKCQQIFGLKEWGIRPIQSKLFEKLTLLWAIWGAEHLQGVGRQDEKEQDIPVSEDLEEEISRCILDEDMNFDSCARHFANWQKEQFEKNRLAACDRQTEEEAEIERDFVIGIIEKEHRQPTFDDAIKYGMRLKEEEIKETLLSEVLPCFMHGGEADEVVAKLDEVLNFQKK